MSPDDPWLRIESTESDLVGRRVDGPHPLAIYWIRSEGGDPGLLIRGIHAGSVSKELPKPRGIRILVTEEPQHGLCARLVLTNLEAKDVFLALCRDVIESSSSCTGAAQATSAIFTRLARWHALLRHGRPTVMDPHEVRGLIGELVVLEHLRCALGPLAGLHAWVAPDDHPQDFATESAILEVKTRLAGSRPHVQISSIEQLESTSLPVRLVVIELTPSSGSGAFTLNAMVDQLLGHYGGLGVEALERIEIALASRGYMRREEYGLDHYVVSGIRGFDVKAEFPRLKRSGVPAAISQARYVLELSAIGEYERPLGEILPGQWNHQVK